jgi:signal transduction histidine kinase/ActR/RegA family two-component response regulator
LPTGAETLSPDRFLVVAPAGRDADVVCELLKSAGLSHEIDNKGETLLHALMTGDGGGAIVTDEAVGRIDRDRLREAIEHQPPWSDFPFILLSRRGEARQGWRAIEELVNVTVLERPLHPATLLSAARSALRGRHRQRLAARHLEDLERARAELRELADTLEEKVEARTLDLAAANDRLVKEIAEREKAEARLLQAQKMEAVGQLTGGIAHDFNNLLTAVVGSLDLLLRRTDDEKLRRLARNALQAAERGADLTSQMLSFSRRQRLTPTSIDPNRIISDMGDMLARTIGPHIRVETRLEPDLWLALADPTQLEVMILNLAINARDAMPGGGRLTIATRNEASVPAAVASELDPGEYVSISVADTGTGMPSWVVAKAFEPFFTTKEPGKGTGLGLAQLYGFAKQSGGTVRIDSAEGQGTTVTIFLPRTRQASAAPTPLLLSPQPVCKTVILLVDDDDDVRTVAAAMIEEAGYEVECAESAAAALAKIEPGRFSLVVTDVAMPVMSGVDLARRIRELVPDLPVIFASGYADVQTFGEELSEEVLLKKPYRVSELAAAIHAALNERLDSGNVIAFPGA